MLINTEKMVSITEANRNFSKVARIVDNEKMIIIMKNNKPRYVMMDYDEYESIKGSEFKVNDELNGYVGKAVTDSVEIVSQDGRVCIPEPIIKKLGIRGSVTFIEGIDQVILANTSSYALKKIQKVMEGKAKEAGLNSPDDVQKLIKEIRKEMWEQYYADND